MFSVLLAAAPVFERLDAQPFILLFLVVAGGYLLGKVHLGSLSLGATASTLVVALGTSVVAAVRGVEFHIPDFASTVFFNLFMFAIGMKVGPQFLAGLRKDARYFIALGLITPLMAIGLALLADFLLHLPPGMATGVLGGANTATPGLGAATDAIKSGAAQLHGATPESVMGNLSTAFAVTYCLSMVGFILMMKVLPHVFRRDVVADAKRFTAETAGENKAPLPGTADEFLTRATPNDVRTFRLENDAIAGHTMGELRHQFPRVAVERVRREGRIIEPRDEETVLRGDIVALAGNTQRLSELTAKGLGPEVSDPELRDVGRETADLVIRNRAYAGKTLGELAPAGYGLYLNAVFRSGDMIPHGPELVIARGDVLRVTGSKRRIAALGDHFGAVVTSSLSTDIVTLALGLAVGATVGALALPIAGIRFSLGSAVGLLLTGIVLSVLRTRNPALGGPFPEPARQLLEDLGLNVFIAVLGLNSGAALLLALKGSAIVPMLVAALVVGFVPPIIAWVIGQYAFKMNGALLMGAVAGGRCNSAGMRASQEETHSTVPAVSYPVTFAISNIVLTLACYLFAIFKP